MNADRYSDFGFDSGLSTFPMSFGIFAVFSFLLWSSPRHFSTIVEMYVVSFVLLFVSLLRRFKTRRESFVSSSGISFNSFSSSSFFHRCSVKRRIFFQSGTRVCQRNSPVFQLMIGFCSCNQGKPKMIFCFPRPVRNNRWVWGRPLIVNVRSAYCLIVPRLFSVPSTLRAFIGFSRL